jgi:site-specific DNA-methyltransferase (adenine-specific)
MTEWVDVKKLAESLQLDEITVKSLIGQSIESEQNMVKLPETDSVEPFLSKNGISIYHDDFITSHAIPDNSVDLIVTSPPYNVGIEYNTHEDAGSYESYLSFTETWLRRAFAVTKSTGRLCLNIPLDKNKGGQQSICADITTIAKRMRVIFHGAPLGGRG